MFEAKESLITSQACFIIKLYSFIFLANSSSFILDKFSSVFSTKFINSFDFSTSSYFSILFFAQI